MNTILELMRLLSILKQAFCTKQPNSTLCQSGNFGPPVDKYKNTDTWRDLNAELLQGYHHLILSQLKSI